MGLTRRLHYKYGARTVHLDGCVEVDAAYYGVPPGWMGKRVGVQWDSLWVRVMHPETGELLRESRKKPRGHRSVHPDDKPSKTPSTTLQLLERASRAGKSTGTLCAEIHRRKEEGGVRQILGVLSLVKRYGTSAIDDACNAALEIQVPTYRFVRRWIERNPPTQLTLRQVDPLIRELSQYRDLIDKKTEGTES